MLSRKTSSRRMRRAKSTSSIQSRRFVQPKKAPADPVTLRTQALTAASLAFDGGSREINRSPTSQQRIPPRQSSRTPLRERPESRSSSQQQSIRFVRPKASFQHPPQGHPSPSLRPARSGYGFSEGSTLLDPSEFEAQLLPSESGLGDSTYGTAIQNGAYSKDNYPLPQSSSPHLRLEKSRSIHNARLAAARTADKDRLQHLRAEQQRRQEKQSILRKPKSISYLPRRRDQDSILGANDQAAAREIARKSFVQQAQPNNADNHRQQPPSLHQKQSFLKKTVRPSSDTSFGNAIPSPNQQLKPFKKSFAQKARTLSVSVRNKIKRVFQRHEEPTTLPPQMIKSDNIHFGSSSGSDAEERERAEKMFRNFSGTHGRQRVPTNVTFSSSEDEQGSSEESVLRTKPTHKSRDDRSRVTTWTDSTPMDSLAGRYHHLLRPMEMIEENPSHDERLGYSKMKNSSSSDEELRTAEVAFAGRNDQKAYSALKRQLADSSTANPPFMHSEIPQTSAMNEVAAFLRAEEPGHGKDPKFVASIHPGHTRTVQTEDSSHLKSATPSMVDGDKSDATCLLERNSPPSDEGETGRNQKTQRAKLDSAPGSEYRTRVTAASTELQQSEDQKALAFSAHDYRRAIGVSSDYGNAGNVVQPFPSRQRSESLAMKPDYTFDDESHYSEDFKGPINNTGIELPPFEKRGTWAAKQRAEKRRKEMSSQGQSTSSDQSAEVGKGPSKPKADKPTVVERPDSQLLKQRAVQQKKDQSGSNQSTSSTHSASSGDSSWSDGLKAGARRRAKMFEEMNAKRHLAVPGHYREKPQLLPDPAHQEPGIQTETKRSPLPSSWKATNDLKQDFTPAPPAAYEVTKRTPVTIEDALAALQETSAKNRAARAARAASGRTTTPESQVEVKTKQNTASTEQVDDALCPIETSSGNSPRRRRPAQRGTPDLKRQSPTKSFILGFSPSSYQGSDKENKTPTRRTATQDTTSNNSSPACSPSGKKYYESPRLVDIFLSQRRRETSNTSDADVFL